MSPTSSLAVEHAQPPRVGDLADRRRARLPAPADARAPSSSRAGSTTHSIRSCDSEIMISNGSMSGSRSGTRETSRSMPTSPLAAISLVLDDSPAAPRSWSATSSSRPDQLEAALDQLALLERVADLDAWAACPRRPRRARRRPARSRRRCRRGPVRAPSSTSTLPGPAAAERISRSAGASPTHIAFTRQFCS